MGALSAADSTIETAREAMWDQEGAAYVAFDDAIGQAQVVYDNAVGTCREQVKSPAGTTNSMQ